MTQKVFNHHDASFSNKDADAILSDFDENAFVIVNNKVYQGHDEIRSVFEQLFVLFSKGTTKLQPVIVKAQTIYIMWDFYMDGLSSFGGSDSFVVENGKIQAQTIYSELYEMFPLN